MRFRKESAIPILLASAALLVFSGALRNGFTDWDIPWEEYVQGSAIPYTPPTSAAPTPTLSPSA